MIDLTYPINYLQAAIEEKKAYRDRGLTEAMTDLINAEIEQYEFAVEWLKKYKGDFKTI